MPLSAIQPSDDAATLYATLQAELLAGQPVTTLHIGGSHTTLASGRGEGEPALRSIAIGSRVTAATCFAYASPTEAELQSAASLIEQAVIPASAMLAAGSALYTADSGIRQIAIASGLQAQPEMLLTLQELEQTVERVTAVALGRPGAPDDLPSDPAFAATLLILRACLRHLGFDRIVIRSDGVV